MRSSRFLPYCRRCSKFVAALKATRLACPVCASSLRAIRFIHLLSSNYSSNASKPQPILVTLNTDQKLREIEGQGIKVYNPR